MKITRTITKLLTGAALAGALLLAAPHKAQAQRIGFGIGIGGPVYGGGYYGPRYVRPYPYGYRYPGYAPGYAYPGYYGGGGGYYGRPYYSRPYYGGGYRRDWDRGDDRGRERRR